MTTANIAIPTNHPNIFAIPFGTLHLVYFAPQRKGLPIGALNVRLHHGLAGMITGRAGNRLEENSIHLPHVGAARLVWPPTCSRAGRHPACDPDAQHINPALVKIEQVRIEQ